MLSHARTTYAVSDQAVCQYTFCMADVREAVAARQDQENNSLVDFCLALGQEELHVPSYKQLMRKDQNKILLVSLPPLF